MLLLLCILLVFLTILYHFKSGFRLHVYLLLCNDCFFAIGEKTWMGNKTDEKILKVIVWKLDFNR